MDGNAVILPPLQMDENQMVIRTDVVVLLGNRSTQMPADVAFTDCVSRQPDSLSVEMRYALFSTLDQPLTYLLGKTERTLTQAGIPGIPGYAALHETLGHIAISEPEAIAKLPLQPTYSPIFSSSFPT